MEWIRSRKLSRTIITVLLLTMTVWLLPAGFMAEKAEAAVILNNPTMVRDSTMESGKKSTWDCVWFGSYPQAEVVCETDTDRISDLAGRSYECQYVTVSSAQWEKITGASYDDYGNATVDGVKYRKLIKTDAVRATTRSPNYYEWGDELVFDIVRYFRYEPIKWRVLDVSGNDAFLVADKALDNQKYDDTDGGDVTWEMCTLRSWLNGYDSSCNSRGIDYTELNFINRAFSSSERSAIKTTDVVNDDDINLGTEGGNNTSDKIFLLSENEVYNSDKASSYGFVKDRNTYDEARRCKTSTYAKAMGATSYVYSTCAGNTRWWLRSPGSDNWYAADVEENGEISHGTDLTYGVTVNWSDAVRPALHLDLSSSNVYSYAGTVSSDGVVSEEGYNAVAPDDSEKDNFFGSERMVRIAGNNRFATSIDAADALKKSLGVGKFENIIVAGGNDYPDALSGSYLAKVKNAPVILVGRDADSEADVKQYISENLKAGGTVYLLGGIGVVRLDFENGVKKLRDSDGNAVNVVRLGGASRYDTNIAILKAAGINADADTAEDMLVCTGEGFADSLSASAVGKPVLLAAKGGLNSTQQKYLDSIDVKDVYLIGGTGVVSERIETQMETCDQDGQCERVAGDDRYKTSVAVAEKFFPDGADRAVLAYANNFPDGLAGGPLAISIKAPLLLVSSSEGGYSAAADYAKRAGIKKAVVLGGKTLITDLTVNKILP